MKKSKKVVLLVPKRRKVAYFIRFFKLVNKFFDIETYSDMAIYYGAIIAVLIGGFIAVSAFIQMLFLG
jgi:hypothetical protein